MTKFASIKNLLTDSEVIGLKNEQEFSSIINQLNYLISKIDNEIFINLLTKEDEKSLFAFIFKIEDSIKSYIATKSNSLCLVINHHISQIYDLFLNKIENFEVFFLGKIATLNSSINELESNLKEKIGMFEIVNRALTESRENAQQGVRNIEAQLGNATSIVSKWSQTVKSENEEQITAKRRQIDKDINQYKEEIKGKFDDLLNGFEAFKFKQLNDFVELDKKKEKFIDMYEVGVKYSKDARFDEYSAKEQKTANIFRWLSLGLMVLVVLMIAYLTQKSISQDINNSNILYSIFSMLSRFFLVFSLMIPAIYSSRESSRHRRNSDKYAQMANELKAFEIAIRTEDMKQETKERIQEEIFKRYFGNIFANNMIDKNIGEDLIGAGRILRPKIKPKKDNK